MSAAGRLDDSGPRVILESGFVPDPETLFVRLRDETVWDRRMRARLTASFGVPYDYSGMEYPETPMPPDLDALGRALQARLGFAPNNCLANYYPDGEATMGFHSDSIQELAPGTGVAILSLGAQRIIRFRSLGDRSVRHDLTLGSGSLLYMPAELQLEWQHAIPRQSGAGERISLTFRQLRRADQGLS